MPFANTIRTVRLALKSLMLHKLRSGLTMLGIVFGVFSVIAMLAIGEGASAQAQKQVLALGATNIIVITVKPPADSQQSQNRGGSRNFTVPAYGLLRSDYDLLTSTLPTISGAVRMREILSEAQYLQRTINARLVGSTTEYSDMNHLQLLRGRFLSDKDEADMANVAVLGAETASTLFRRLQLRAAPIHHVLRWSAPRCEPDLGGGAGGG